MMPSGTEPVVRFYPESTTQERSGNTARIRKAMGQRKITQGLVPRIAIGVFGLLTVAMILLAIFDERGALALGKRRAELENLNTDIEQTIEKNKALQTNIYNLLHDPDAIERRAREQLKLVRPGEIVIETPPATESLKKDQTKQPE